VTGGGTRGLDRDGDVGEGGIELRLLMARDAVTVVYYSQQEGVRTEIYRRPWNSASSAYEVAPRVYSPFHHDYSGLPR